MAKNPGCYCSCPLVPVPTRRPALHPFESLPPGAVAGEFGWGGLAGPAWTIDPRPGEGGESTSGGGRIKNTLQIQMELHHPGIQSLIH